MPFYDYRCPCRVKALERPYEARKDPLTCDECGEPAEYMFPLSAAKGFQPFESYYNEALDSDVHGRRHLQEILRAKGLQEAGDKVNGARLSDENKGTSAHMMRKQPPKGVDYGEQMRKQDEARKLVPELDIRTDIPPE